MTIKHEEDEGLTIDGEAVELEEEEQELEEPEVEEPEEPEAPAEDEEEDEEVTVSIGDAEPEAVEPEEQAPSWVKELRKTHRDTVKENKRLQKELEALKAPKEPENKPLRAKPTLESSDYEADVYEADLEKWYMEKAQHDAKQAEAEKAKRAEQEAWEQRLNHYTEQKTSLRVKDFEEAEAEAQAVLNPTQQGIIVQGADNPAAVIYALGKHPKKAEELAAIADPVRFAIEIGKLEKDLKVTSKRTAPPPETKVESGSSSKGNSANTVLERLRDEAARTGDFSKVHEYKRKLRKKK